MKAVAKLVWGSALVAALAVPASVAPVSAAPAKVKNACKLLKTSEIKAEFGPDIAKPQLGPGPGCTWELGTEPGVVGAGTIGTFLLTKRGKTAFDSGRATYPDITDVDGIGKDAYFLPAVGTLWVLKTKKTVLYVQGVIIGENVGPDENAAPDLLEKLEVLAKKALKRA